MHITAGALSKDLLDEHLRVLEQLAVRRTWQSVCKLMHEYVDTAIGLVQPERRTDLQRFVAWMVADIKSSLEMPRSLVQYADAAG